MSVKKMQEDMGEWDKTAADENCFYWASDDEDSTDYGTVIGYTAKIDGSTYLKFPSRCTKIAYFGGRDVGGSFTFGDGTTVDASRTFTRGIVRIDLPETIKEIESYAFSPGTQEAFYNLQILTLPNSLSKINSRTFYCLPNLNEIKIPYNIIEIEDGAFYGCTNLNRIFIPNTVKKIKGAAFQICDNLEIYTNASEKMADWADLWNEKEYYPWGVTEYYPVHYGVSLEQFNALD